MENNSILFDKFSNCRTKDARLSFMQHLLNLRGKYPDKVVFVEGCDDIRVFEKIYSKKYPTTKICFVPTYGKANIPIFFEEIELGKFSEDIQDYLLYKNKTTIVDADYDLHMNIDLFSQPSLRAYKIKYLKVYSLENFFFTKINFTKIANIYNLEENEVKYVVDKLQNFHDFIVDFELCTYYKTKAKEFNLGPKLYELPALSDLKHYDINLDDSNFVFNEKIAKSIVLSKNSILDNYREDEIINIKNYIKNINNIRGKSFRTLFYSYISSKKIKKLPDFYDLFDICTELEIELPNLE